MLVVARFLEELQPKPTVVSASRLELLYVASNSIIESSILRPWIQFRLEVHKRSG